MNDQKCPECTYPLSDSVPVEDTKGQRGRLCKNCGSVIMIKSKTSEQKCPCCKKPLEDFESRGKVFYCPNCELFVHDGQTYYKTPAKTVRQLKIN